MITDADGKIDREISEVSGFEFLDLFAGGRDRAAEITSELGGPQATSKTWGREEFWTLAAAISFFFDSQRVSLDVLRIRRSVRSCFPLSCLYNSLLMYYAQRLAIQAVQSASCFLWLIYDHEIIVLTVTGLATQPLNS